MVIKMEQEKPEEIKNLEVYLGKPFFQREIRIESPVYVGVYCHTPEGYTKAGEPFGRRSFWFETEGNSKLNFLGILSSEIEKYFIDNNILGSNIGAPGYENYRGDKYSSWAPVTIGDFYKTKNGSLIRKKTREYVRHEDLGEEIDRESNIVKNRVREQAIDTIEIFDSNEKELNQTYEEVKRELDKLKVIVEEQVKKFKENYEKIGMKYGS